MYDMHFSAAERTLKRFRQQHPQDPMGPLSEAAKDLFQQLEITQALRKDFFGKKTGGGKPNAAVDLNFRRNLAETHQLASRALRKSPQSAAALLAEVLAKTLQADYDFLVKNAGIDALNLIKQATEESKQVLSICPDCSDADLASAVENYILGQQSGIDRLMLRLGGAETSETKGLEELKRVAANGRYFRTYAKALLAIAAIRNNDKSQARELMAELSKQFPHNTFFRFALQSVT